MKYIRIFIFFLLTGLFVNAQVPQKPYPIQFVNDYAQIFSPQQQNNLERILGAFSDSTSNQIVIVTMSNLQGMDRADLAYRIGEEWQVGQKDFDNGIVILIKPKNNTKGEVFIATGYGLEGVITDALSRRIIEQQMIPAFQQNDYYQGVINALNILLPAAMGEYNYAQEENIPLWPLLVIFFFIIFIAIILSKNKGGDNYHGDGNGGGGRGLDILTGILLGSMAGRSHSGSWGGFSGGGHGGSFGGGSFGGGGAGGSW